MSGKSVSGILAGLSPDARKQRFQELLLADPPFQGVDALALQAELTEAEKLTFFLAGGARLLAAYLTQRAQRPTLTPEEKAAHKLAEWLRTVAPLAARCDSFTLEEFAWLCVQEDFQNPAPMRDLWVSAIHKEHEAILNALRRCVGVSLTALPPVPKMGTRFDASALATVAVEDKLGLIALLTIRQFLEWCRQHAPRSRSLPPYPFLAASPALADEQLDAQRSAGARRQAQWYDCLNMCLERIERGARQTGEPFSRRALPGSVKQLLPLLIEDCHARGIKLTVKSGTVMRRLSSLKWGFGGAGSRTPTDQLKTWWQLGETSGSKTS